MKKSNGWITMGPLLLLLFLLWAPTSQAGLGDQVFETTLSNGLKVILLENPKAPLITFHIWYRVGSRNEEWGKTGLSHVLEHMMFKGTKKYGPEDYSRIIQENGGETNAFTSRDYTGYFATLRSDRVQVLMDLEADRMPNLNLREEDFVTERMVVMEERRQRTEDDPQSFLMEQLEATAFQVQPYHWPIIGWMEDIMRITLEDLKRHYQTYYSPANSFLVAVGDFKKGEMLSRIEKTFGSIPPGTAQKQEKPQDPPQTGERRISLRKEAQLPFLVMGYRVPNLHHPDAYVLEVISAILSGGKSSRFYQKLVLEKELVLEADAENSLLSKDPALFYVYATPLPGKQVGEVEKALEEEIERLQKEPVDKRELEKVKNQLESSFIYSQDSLFFQAMLLARYEIAQSWKVIDQYLPLIQRVTPEDIQRVARQYLISDNRTAGTLIPLPPKPGQEPSVGSSGRDRITR
ncbi:MAG: pitrilysin family protein [Deltaproteobacteria bacterium]|nr:pitrilysin family protein [Deltaproteobacteria bacterium]